MSDSYNVGWEGVFIPPTLLQHSKNAPPVLTKVKSLHRGCLVISLGRTVRIGHSYSSHMLHDAWWPSTGAFSELRDAPPLSFVTSLSTVASWRFWASPSGAGPWRVPWTFGDREQSSSLFLPIKKKKEWSIVVSESCDLRRTFGLCHLREGAIPNTNCRTLGLLCETILMRYINPWLVDDYGSITVIIMT